MQSIRINIFGKVQGVFFRAHTFSKAKELNITGTVENLPDGSVQIIAEGESDNIDEFIQWCNKGPLLARVDKVKTDNIPVSGYTDFKII